VIQPATDVIKVRTSSSSAIRSAVASWPRSRIAAPTADNWIRHVQDVRNRHAAWLETVPAQRANALCDCVVEQALNVCQTTIVQDAWQRGQEVVVHGWVWRGLLQDLAMTVTRLDDAGVAYETAIAAVRSRYPSPAPA
jgi:carbonic anhydrase